VYYSSYNNFGCSDEYVESDNFTILQNCSSDSDCKYGEKCINEICRHSLPDLVAEIDYYPKNATVGDNVTVVQTIKNLGDVDLTDVGIFYTDCVNFPQPLFALIGSKVGYGVNISANSEINFTFTFTVKYGVNYSKFIIRTRVDTWNEIDETNETNNNASIVFNFSIPFPDLVAEINYSPSNASPGDNVAIVQKIKNLGECNLTNVRIAFRDSYSSKLAYFNLSANSEINFTLNFTVRYGKFTVETIVDFDNKVDETNETNNNATLIFDFPILVKTDKKVYKIGETANISIIGNLSDSIQVMYNGGTALDKFQIFRFENNTWKEIRVKCPFQSPVTCENGTLKYHGLGNPILWDCYVSSVNSSLSWDQTECNLVNLTCGNTTYNRWKKFPATPGIYKVRLQYNGYYDSQYYNSSSSGYWQCIGYGNRILAESDNFTILQNCSSNSNCAYGEKCINETCLQVQNYCENTSQCADNQICVNNTCSNLSCEYWQIARNHGCIKNNDVVYGGSSGGNSGGGTQYTTLQPQQTQPVTANKTNETVNKSAEKQNETKTEKQNITEGKILKITLENKSVIAGEKFNVKIVDNEGNAVENVTVNYNGIIKFTDFEGKVEFVALNESVELKANKDGYKETGESKVTITPVLKAENGNGGKDRGKISEETKQTNPDDKLPLVMLVAIITSIVTILLLLKMFKKK